MNLDYHIIDVFTDQRFSGNPLAVVDDAARLKTAEMQQIAREFNLSETVFLLPPENPAHSARIRIFTPQRELPFAGHPTVGTAILLAELRAPDANGDRDAIIALEEAIGTVRVGVRTRSGAAPFAEFDAPKLPEISGATPSTERIAAALGLIPREIGFENHHPVRVSAGNSFLHVPVASMEALAKARVNAPEWVQSITPLDVVGAFVYTRQCVHTTSSFHARMFAPEAGVVEDPATGSAAVGFAAPASAFDEYPDGVHKRIIEQGYEIGRPSHIMLTLVVRGGKLTVVRIGGNAVRVAEGRLTV
ncbi:MAG: PhzF family phenazine biosynthesis protein [Hyphomicrobiaceae bacterium]|nr:PhzF family phenazine biosynthesis protein [Hyphomicrobiaceae bacterium]